MFIMKRHILLFKYVFVVLVQILIKVCSIDMKSIVVILLGQ